MVDTKKKKDILRETFPSLMMVVFSILCFSAKFITYISFYLQFIHI